ncbi:MAG: hypothetical protein GX248_09275, partial [Peptococcaceae bacterium]|nr:hypothetical protein [Peptococcaceae bacterium]
MKKKLIPVLLVFTLLLLLLGGGNVLATTDSTSRALDPVVSTSWLAANKNKVVILDVRSADDYKAGHIPTAKSLPTPWIWEEDGTYRSMDILDLMASGVAGEDK